MPCAGIRSISIDSFIPQQNIEILPHKKKVRNNNSRSFSSPTVLSLEYNIHIDHTDFMLISKGSYRSEGKMKKRNWKKKTVIAGIAFLLLGSGNGPIHLAAEDTPSPAPTSAESSAPDAASPLDTQEEPGGEKAFHITYQSSSSDMGSVTSAEETGVVSEDSKTVQYSGSEAVPNSGYQFVNWTAEENGTLTLSKSNPEYSEDTDRDSYLTYTLTIASGDAAMPDVTVTDHFTKNEAAVEEYVGIYSDSLKLSGTSQPYETISGGDGTAVQNPGTILLISPKTDTSPGAFKWTIGSMRANETRTLTYSVKLRSGYAGAAGANNGVVENTATPASGNNTRSSVTSTFTPKTGATVSKNAGTITIKDNIVTIPYTVTAASTNTRTLRNVKISDDFGTYSTNHLLSNLLMRY